MLMLVIDDHQPQRELYKHILEDAGDKSGVVFWPQKGESVTLDSLAGLREGVGTPIARLNVSDIDVALVDYRLGAVGAFEVIAILRESAPAPYIFVMSGVTPPECLEFCAEHGVGFVTKDELVMRPEKFMALAESIAEERRS